MKFNNRYSLKPLLGQRRVVRKFLILPRRFESQKTRWLEYADIVEEVMRVDVGGSCEWGCYSYCWREVGFKEEVVCDKLMNK